ncbi:Fic family protein [Candidatus Poriferisodalis sp.]|uniref:Fic family protein n=1 Tax=Candidatus Poriferisodalis sp. TaxID=3101277 RepID=UPI003B01F6F9
MGRFVEFDFAHWHGTSLLKDTYQAYVPHPLGDWLPTPNADTMERFAEAQHRLSDLTDSIENTPALRWCLNRTEAIASSSVEGIETTLRSISLLDSLRGQRRHTTDLNDEQALGNALMHSYALELGDDSSRPLSVADIEDLHRRLFKGTATDFEPGRLRTEPAWVGDDLRTPHGAAYVAPPHELVPSLMGDLVEYASRPMWGSPVAKAAFVHTQFETIHPFPDGNGRVGRALMHLVMRRDGRLPVAAPLSAAIDARKMSYYDSLRPYQTFTGDSDDAERAAAMYASAEFVADAMSVACTYTTLIADALSNWRRQCDDRRFRADSAASEILQIMQTMPALTQSRIAEEVGRPLRSVTRALRQLVDAELIAEVPDSESGERVFQVPAILYVVDNRRDLLDQCWLLHARESANVIDLLQEQVTAAIDAQQHAPEEPRAQPRCGHVGTRRRKKCIRRAGHSGNHSY